MRFCFIVIAASFFLFGSCKKDPARTKAVKHLWRTEKHAIQNPNKTFVTYFTYDAQDRITQASLYIVDSTGPALDSVLMQKYTYQYSGSSATPDYAEWLNNSIATPPNYGLFGSQKTYSGTQLTKDSAYLISSIPAQSSVPIVRNYTYSGNQVSRLFYSGAILFTKDTFNITNGNTTKIISRSQLNSFATERTNSFDSKINPITVPLMSPISTEAYLPNANNIITTLYKYLHANDSIRWISQFQYDTDDYPVLELLDEYNYFIPPSVLNYKIYYRYY